MTTIYVLFGETGEYSDRQEWAVRGYTTQADADADCAALNVAVKAVARGFRDPVEDAVRMRLTAHYAFAEVHSGTTYSVTAVPLVDVAQVPIEAHGDASMALAQRERDRVERTAAEAYLATWTSPITRKSDFTGYQFYGKAP